MSAHPQQLAAGFDAQSASRAILRYQPASNWVSVSRDPTQRMTIGLGFDVSRPDAAEMLARVGLDPPVVRSGRTPISDAQMIELFELTLHVAVETADQRVPGFAAMAPEKQWALLELIMWLGPDEAEAVFSELEGLSLPLTHEVLEPSSWFDESHAIMPASRRPVSGWYVNVRSATTFESFGLVAELVSDDADLLHAAQAMLPPGWRPIGGAPSVRFGLWTDGAVTVDGSRVDRSPHREASLLKLGAVIRHHIATEAPGFTFVHAGVVDVGGCGIVIPGRTYTGKSTLVAELVRRGATYVSDEYAVLGPDGVVQPFAKPLSIRGGGRGSLGQLVQPPQASVADRPVRAGLIVITSYAPGARWRPTTCSRAEGALALLQNTVSARLRPGSALPAIGGLARSAVFLVGQRGEASDTARALLETALLQSEGSTTFPA